KLKLSDVRDFLKRTDMLLFVLCLAASIMGIVVISSATSSWGSASYVSVQIFALVIGIVLYFLFTVIDIDIISDQWPLLLVIEVGLLLLLIPFGIAGDTGNKGWIRFFGIGIQPSEVVKVIYIVLSAKHMAYLKEYRSLSAPLSVLQIVLHFGFLFVLLLGVSDDLGSALVFFFIFLVMAFASGLKLYWFVFGAAAMAVVIPIAWNNVLTTNQKERILAPYIPDVVDPDGYGITWEQTHAKLALASGRLTGTGLYQGSQTQSEAIASKHADYIFAAIGEELGMIGCLVVIGLLTAIIIRCVVVGLHSNSTMGMLICFGVAAMITFQMFENIGMCLGLTPVIGLTLPFFSYGGSSLFSTFAAMGIVSGIHFQPKLAQFRSYNTGY
ncbi:MAG: FtsW/RodA/SpoVE family cell cycle protein, partial [Oscillospiraceae bacterium]|nr:FtsW/RodA/SpoVE family cell cycle protein [Oscillospiraceae bacterium]